MSDCPPRVKLLALIAAGEHVPHLDDCDDCADFVAAATDAVSAFADRDEVEQAVAKRIDAILADTPSHRWASTLIAEREMRRSVVVRDLLRRADQMYGSNSGEALDLTTAAVNICDAMTASGEAPSPELRFQVLKEHAMVLHRMERHTDALSIISRAWPVALHTRASQLNRAVLSLCGAIVYVEPDIAKFDEAVDLAETANAVLSECGDERRAIIARQTKAYVLLVSERFDEALPLLREATRALDNLAGESRDAAIAHVQLAECLIHLGLYDEAVEHASIGERLHRTFNGTTDAACAAHLRVRAIAALGRFGEVREEFARTAEIVFGAHLFSVWSEMRLDFVAAALADDEGADVRTELESIVRVCMTASAHDSTPRQRFAAEALSYLRQLAARDALTLEAVDHVRAFIARNASRPPVKFTRPPGAFLM